MAQAEPIKTAPANIRDGRQILIAKNGTWQICWWSPSKNAWSYGGGHWIEDEDDLVWAALPILERKMKITQRNDNENEKDV